MSAHRESRTESEKSSRFFFLFLVSLLFVIFQITISFPLLILFKNFMHWVFRFRECFGWYFMRIRIECDAEQVPRQMVESPGIVR